MLKKNMASNGKITVSLSDDAYDYNNAYFTLEVAEFENPNDACSVDNDAEHSGLAISASNDEILVYLGAALASAVKQYSESKTVRRTASIAAKVGCQHLLEFVRKGKNSVQPLVDALSEYDRTRPEREKLWDDVESNEDVAIAEKADKDALVKVQEAFYQVTKNRNSREHCARVDIDFARQVAAIEHSRPTVTTTQQQKPNKTPAPSS